MSQKFRLTLRESSVEAFLQLIRALLSIIIMAAPNLTSAEPNRMFSTPLKPLCVGRFLVDVPANVKLNWAETSTYSFGSLGTTDAATPDAFNAVVKTREAMLRGTPHRTEGSAFKEAINPPKEFARILVYRAGARNTSSYEIEGYVHKQGATFVVKTSAVEDRLHLANQQMMEALDTVQPRATWELPRGPGLCFDTGFLPGAGFDLESVGVGISFPDHPGLRISINVNTSDEVADPQQALFARAQSYTGRSDLIRRTSDKLIAGSPAQELVRRLEQDGNIFLTARAEVQALPNRLDKPTVQFVMHLDSVDPITRAKLEKVASQEDALRLWDDMLKSFRLRPGAL